MDTPDILNEIVWVRLTYPDNSEFCFQTTLNSTILNRRGIVLQEGKLVRLDKQYLYGTKMQYKQFSIENCKVDILSSKEYRDANSAFLHDFL